MTAAWRSRLALGMLLLGACFVFCRGLAWGLPARRVDPYLFGRHPVWSGREILELAGDRAYNPALGADVDINPIDRSQPVWLNQTDRQRAEIILRYRLYTYQPDEMITMMALAAMRPSAGDFDPKLYQYGGLWIYPVGALLGLGHSCGLLKLTADKVYYLDHPEEFARLYLVARLYVVAWALVGVWAVYRLARRFTSGDVPLAFCAAACCVVMPVVVNMSHEAKPHLPGAVLMLLAVLAGLRCLDTGRTLWWFVASCLCGAAFGMVLSAWPVFLILPTLAALLPGLPRDRRMAVAIIGAAIGLGVYLLTNPYILINSLINPQVLRSNLGNSAAMYQVSRLGEGLLNAARLLSEATGPVLGVVGVIGAVGLAVLSRVRRCELGAGLLVAVPSLAVLIQFIALAAGKPAEYGRFAVFPAMVLCVGGMSAVAAFVIRRGWRFGCGLLLFVATLLPGFEYLSAFRLDSGSRPSRLRVASVLLEELGGGATIGVEAEPAPYVMPPVDLFQNRIVLLPSGTAPEALPLDALIRVADTYRGIQTNLPPGFRWRPTVSARQFYIGPASMSWADKPFILLLRERVVDANQLQPPDRAETRPE